MGIVLKILLLDESAEDAAMINRLLHSEKPACELKLVTTENEFKEALDQFLPDIVLAENTIPGFGTAAALNMVRHRKVFIPFILVVKATEELFALNMIKLGADDYLFKDRLKRLPVAIAAAIGKKRDKLKLSRSKGIKRYMVNASLDAIICTDITGAIILCNPQAEKMFGLQESEMIGNTLADTISPHQNNVKEAGLYADYFKKDNADFLNRVMETTAVDHNGNEFPVELSIVLLKEFGEELFFIIIKDISDRRKAEAALRELKEDLEKIKVQEQKKISKAIIKGQETERNHIGKELHDNISQMLAGTKIFLDIASKKREEIGQLLKYPMQLLESCIEEVRSLSHQQVTPLKHANLEEALRELLGNLNQAGMYRIALNYSVPCKFLADDLKLNIYRIVQEQISNILRHAEAKNAEIVIKAAAKHISILITDDGKGFRLSDKRKGIGISNMRHRVESYNGEFKLKSSPGKGCRLEITIPY